MSSSCHLGTPHSKRSQVNYTHRLLGSFPPASHTLYTDQAKQTAVVSDTGVISLVNDRGNSCTLSQIRMEEQLERHLRFLKSGESIQKHLSVKSYHILNTLCFLASSLKLCQESLSTLVSCDFLSTLSDSMVAALTGIFDPSMPSNPRVNIVISSVCL